MSDIHNCPHCGFNLKRDEPLHLDGFVLDPRGTVAYLGDEIALTGREASLMHLVAANKGRPITYEAIKSAWDVDGNMPEVILHRVRRKLGDQQIPCPLKTVWGRGLQWGIAA